MHITWLVSGGVEKRLDGRLSSSMASVRYRVLYAAEHMAARGHRVDIIQAGLPAGSPELDAPLRAQVVIVSKGLFHESTAIVERAQRLGARVIFDVCDDHFDTPYRDTYFTLCRLADDIVASTPTMARVIAERAGRKASVIGDPFEAPHGEPRFAPAERLQLLWFGHPTNFDTLSAMMPALANFSRQRPVELHVVSEDTANIVRALKQVAAEHSPGLQTRFTPWSVDATWKALADCDMVLIPSMPGDAKQVKSPNRMVEAIRRGRFVAAYPLPSYEQFANHAWLGENVVEGIRWALAHPRMAVARVATGQATVAADFAPAKLATQWEAAITRYATSRPISLFKPSMASVLTGSMASARL